MESKRKPISIVHVEHVHFSSFVRLTSEYEDEICYSQFNVAKTILANPEAVVLDESIMADLRADVINAFSFSADDMLSIKECFENKFPEKYDDLNPAQKKVLIEKGATLVLFSLKMLNCIFAAADIHNNAEFYIFCQKKKIDREKTPIETLFKKYPDAKKLIFDKRENTALKLAKKAAESNKNSIVLLVYGARHKFRERVRKIEDFIYEGRVVTTRVDYCLKEKLGEKVLPSGKLITPSDPKDLLKYQFPKLEAGSTFKFDDWINKINELKMDNNNDKIIKGKLINILQRKNNIRITSINDILDLIKELRMILDSNKPSFFSSKSSISDLLLEPIKNLISQLMTTELGNESSAPKVK